MDDDAAKHTEAPDRNARRRQLIWAGMVLALTIMVAATGITVGTGQRWGMYLFGVGVALYIVCRCVGMGLLNTMPKILALALMVAGALLMSRWRIPSALGYVGLGCVVAAAVLLVASGRLQFGRRG